MLKRISLLLLMFFCLTSFAYAERANPEKYYADFGCQKLNGVREYFIEGNRVDCVTTTEVIEFEFADKWYEGLGQALFYAHITGKQPAVVFIVETADAKKFVFKAQPVLFKYGVKIYTMGIPVTGNVLIIPQTLTNLTGIDK